MQGDYDDRLALHVAAANGKLLAVSYLLSICADPNVKDRWGGTPIDDALRGNHLHCAKLIQAFGGELGDNPSAEILEQHEKLSDISIKDAQDQVSQALAKVRMPLYHISLWRVRKYHSRHPTCRVSLLNPNHKP